jgi:hypothetical protein
MVEKLKKLRIGKNNNTHWLKEEIWVIRISRRDFISSGVFAYSILVLGKYPGNGGKAEKTKDW